MSSNVLPFSSSTHKKISQISPLLKRENSQNQNCGDNVVKLVSLSTQLQKDVHLTSGLWINDVGLFAQNEELNYCSQINPYETPVQLLYEDNVYISSIRDFKRFSHKCREPLIGFLFSTVSNSFENLSPIEFFILHEVERTEFERTFELRNRGLIQHSYSSIDGAFFIPQKNQINKGIAVFGAKSIQNQREFSNYLEDMGIKRGYFFS
ncbi:MAG: hypothetical protein LAT82_03430 [Nanoarchaeota archaeon]|nr:hypothetical protein [Nanoarchaeota archaeon]